MWTVYPKIRLMMALCGYTY